MRILLLFTLQFFIVFSVSAAIWTVNDPSDLNPTTGGTGSGASGDLRYCVTNASYGDVISFNLASPYTITLSADLIPNNGLIIDGSTQPGFSSVPLVNISGTGTIILNGSSDLYVKYLRFNTTGKAAITTNYVDGVYIDGCYFGTDATGLNYSTSAPDTAIYVASSSYGVYIGNNAPNVILTPTGIVMDNNASSIYVYYNMIGLNKNGFIPGGVKTNNKGISLIQSNYIYIQYNRIGNCNSFAISIDANSYNNNLYRNYIGKSINGIAAPNGVGMLISGYSNTIDTDSISNSKKISGSSGAGVEFSGSGAVGNNVTSTSFFCNEGGGIKFTNGAVPNSVPAFDASSDTIYGDGRINITGTCNAGDYIQFFLQDNCSFGPQGTYIGAVSSYGLSTWSFNGYLYNNGVPLAGGTKITAIAVSSSGTPSVFSNTINIVAFPCSSVKVIAGNNITACDNSPILLNGTLINASYAYYPTWSTSGKGTFTPDYYYSTGTPTYYDPTNDIAAGASSVNISLTAAVVGCPPVTGTFTVSLPIPQAVVFGGNSNEYVCFNKAGIPLDLKLYNATLGGTWSTTGTGSFSPSATALNASYIPSVADSVNGANITFTPNKSATGCNAINNIVNMAFSGYDPIIYGTGDMKVCSNTDPTLNSEIFGISYTEFWTYLNGSPIKDSIDYYNSSYHYYVPSASDLAKGSASILHKVTTPGCKPAFDTTVFTFVKAPIVSIGMDSAIFCGNATSLTLNKATVSGAPGGYIKWTGLAYGNNDLKKKANQSAVITKGLFGSPISGILKPDSTLNTVYIPDPYGWDRSAPDGVVLFLTVQTADLVCTVSDDLPIIFMSVPDSVYAGPDLTLCQGDTIPLSGFVSPGYPVKWSTPGSGIFLDNTSLNTGYVPSSGDNKRIAFNLSLIGGDKLCPVKDELLLILLPKPDVGVGANQTICPETGVTLTGALGDDQIGLWTLVSGSGIFSDSSKSTVSVSNINDKENSYLWTVTDTTTHCTNSATYKVNYCFAPPLKVFNALSPNNDGLGEFMEIENIGFYPDNRVCIFNNWGDLVFKTDKYTNTGDNVFVGKSNVGTIQELPSGTYFFLIDKNYKEEKADKGIVVIQR